MLHVGVKMCSVFLLESSFVFLNLQAEEQKIREEREKAEAERKEKELADVVEQQQEETNTEGSKGIHF